MAMASDSPQLLTPKGLTLKTATPYVIRTYISCFLHEMCYDNLSVRLTTHRKQNVPAKRIGSLPTGASRLISFKILVDKCR